MSQVAFNTGFAVSKPGARNADVVSASGPIYTIPRMLIPSSTFSLITGTDTNLTSSGDTVVAQAAIPPGTSQVAMVRESYGYLAVEYPLTLRGT